MIEYIDPIRSIHSMHWSPLTCPNDKEQKARLRHVWHTIVLNLHMRHTFRVLSRIHRCTWQRSEPITHTYRTRDHVIPSDWYVLTLVVQPKQPNKRKNGWLKLYSERMLPHVLCEWSNPPQLRRRVSVVLQDPPADVRPSLVRDSILVPRRRIQFLPCDLLRM